MFWPFDCIETNTSNCMHCLDHKCPNNIWPLSWSCLDNQNFTDFQSSKSACFSFDLLVLEGKAQILVTTIAQAESFEIESDSLYGSRYHQEARNICVRYRSWWARSNDCHNYCSSSKQILMVTQISKLICSCRRQSFHLDKRRTSNPKVKTLKKCNVPQDSIQRLAFCDLLRRLQKKQTSLMY